MFEILTKLSQFEFIWNTIIKVKIFHILFNYKIVILNNYFIFHQTAYHIKNIRNLTFAIQNQDFN